MQPVIRLRSHKRGSKAWDVSSSQLSLLTQPGQEDRIRLYSVETSKNEPFKPVKGRRNNTLSAILVNNGINRQSDRVTEKYNVIRCLLRRQRGSLRSL